ncbi:MAG: hypothetical protein K6T91_03385 [Firmicutes bacterium]|nr:hypothetical protein [Bacillota bacterium]
MFYSIATVKNADKVIPFSRSPRAGIAKPARDLEQMRYFAEVFLLIGTSILATAVMISESNLANTVHAGAIFLTGLSLQIVVPFTYGATKNIFLWVEGPEGSSRGVRLAAALTSLAMVPLEAIVAYMVLKSALQSMLD